MWFYKIDGELESMDKKLYETMVLVDSSVGEKGLPEVIRHVSGLIGRFEGSIERIEKWGERELAYPIEHVKSGIYILFYFRADAAVVSEIRRLLQMSEQVLRFILIKAEEMPPPGEVLFSEEGEVIEVPEDEESEEKVDDASEKADDEAVAANEDN